MAENLFKELLDSIKEAGKIKRRQVEPSRVFNYERPDEVRSTDHSAWQDVEARVGCGELGEPHQPA